MTGTCAGAAGRFTEDCDCVRGGSGNDSLALITLTLDTRDVGVSGRGRCGLVCDGDVGDVAAAAAAAGSVESTAAGVGVIARSGGEGSCTEAAAPA